MPATVKIGSLIARTPGIRAAGDAFEEEILGTASMGPWGYHFSRTAVPLMLM